MPLEWGPGVKPAVGVWGSKPPREADDTVVKIRYFVTVLRRMRDRPIRFTSKLNGRKINLEAEKW